MDAGVLGAPGRHTTDDLGSLLVHLVGRLLETAEPLDAELFVCGGSASTRGAPAAGVP